MALGFGKIKVQVALLKGHVWYTSFGRPFENDLEQHNFSTLRHHWSATQTPFVTGQRNSPKLCLWHHRFTFRQVWQRCFIQCQDTIVVQSFIPWNAIYQWIIHDVQQFCFPFVVIHNILRRIIRPITSTHTQIRQLEPPFE